jgi:hypothetical protein
VIVLFSIEIDTCERIAERAKYGRNKKKIIFIRKYKTFIISEILKEPHKKLKITLLQT